MAVNTFTFGGVTSSTYGIYVSGEALFNAPKRDAEVIQIPGRDGDYVLDKGSFQNIEVTYRVFNQEKDLTDFRTKLANLRSALCSKKGYQRLTDTFHPDEYRMAAFIDGIEVNPVKYNTASEFEIKFNCKPQRFLTSGETAVAVANGGTLTNPTLFDSRPQLQVWGGGTIHLGANDVTITSENIGDVVLYAGGNQTGAIVVDDTFANSGDLIDVERATGLKTKTESSTISNVSSVTTSGTITAYRSYDAHYLELVAYLDTSELSFTYGTAKTVSGSASFTYKVNNNTKTMSLSISLAYDGADTFTFSSYGGTLGTIILHSTQTTTGSPAYIDLDTGEAYKIENDISVSINNAVTIPPELPTIPPGNTTVTYDNTITQLKVLPRWWKV